MPRSAKACSRLLTASMQLSGISNLSGTSAAQAAGSQAAHTAAFSSRRASPAWNSSREVHTSTLNTAAASFNPGAGSQTTAGSSRRDGVRALAALNSMPAAVSTVQPVAVANTGRGGQASARHSSSATILPPHCARQRRSPQLKLHFQLRAGAAEFVPSGWAPAQRRPGLGRPLQSVRGVATAELAADYEATAAAGSLIEFRKDQKMGLALIQEADGKRNWRAIDTRGISYSLRPQQISYVLPGKDYTPEDLQSIFLQANAQAADHTLMETAWEVVKEDEQFHTVVQMAELLFGETSPVSCYAAHRLLNEDRTYFKQVGRSPPMFQARSEREVAAAQAMLAAARQAEELKAACVAAFRDAMARPFSEKPKEADWLAGPWAARIQALQSYALLQHDPKYPPEVPRLVLETMQPVTKGSASPQAAALLLKQLGVWPPHLHLAPLRAGLTHDFGASVLAEAAELAASPPRDPDAERRQDLTHMTVWAVDSAETTEVDDAISMEPGPDGRHRLWVHIADPTRWLQPGTALDREAARRTTSLYLPTGSVSMFPRELGEEVFSLRPGQEGSALSICVVLDDKGAILERSATCSTIRPTRITYDDLDRRLPAADEQNDADLHALLKTSQLRRRWREQQGAVQISMPECEVHVREPDSIYPDIVLQTQSPEDSQARTLVSELMIMANEAVATIGASAGLPLPYRGQAAIVMPSEEELEAVPDGMCREYLIRSRMTRSVCTTSGPLPHAGLGLPGYVQATSPIRRYMDLLAHWQLKAHIRGETPPFNADTLNDTVELVHSLARECTLVDREVSKYWLTEFFSRQLKEDPHRKYPATMLAWIRGETGFAKAILDDFGLEVALRINRPAVPGESIQLFCSLADASNSELHFEEWASTAGRKRYEDEAERSDDEDGAQEVVEVVEVGKEVLQGDQVELEMRV